MSFNNSLNRSRAEFSASRAKNLSLEAKECREDMLREINKKIRDKETILTSIEDDAHQDDLLVALKKGGSIDVRRDIVEKRYATLLELRNLYIKRNIMVKDSYFDVDDEVMNVTVGRYENLVADDEDAVGSGEAPVE